MPWRDFEGDLQDLFSQITRLDVTLNNYICRSKFGPELASAFTIHLHRRKWSQYLCDMYVFRQIKKPKNVPDNGGKGSNRRSPAGKAKAKAKGKAKSSAKKKSPENKEDK